MTSNTPQGRIALRIRKYLYESYRMWLYMLLLAALPILIVLLTGHTAKQYDAYLDDHMTVAAITTVISVLFAVYYLTTDLWQQKRAVVSRMLPMNDGERFAAAWFFTLFGWLVWYALLWGLCTAIGYAAGWYTATRPTPILRPEIYGWILPIGCLVHAFAFTAATAARDNLLRNYAIVAGILILLSILSNFPILENVYSYLVLDVFTLNAGANAFYNIQDDESRVNIYVYATSGMPNQIGMWVVSLVLWVVSYFKFREHELK